MCKPQFVNIYNEGSGTSSSLLFPPEFDLMMKPQNVSHLH